MKIAVIDYGAGNLNSVVKALECFDVNYIVSDSSDEIETCDAMILPGVGAFGDAMNEIKLRGLDKTLIKLSKTKPLLGICLGMQLLFEKSYEFGEFTGLGLIEGYIDKIKFNGLKIPHMGWNDLQFLNPSPLLKNSAEGEYVYFVHSYKAITNEKYINAFTEYGETIPAVISNKNVYGTQFHPEKSGETGLNILRAFIDIAKQGK